ncbi:MAG: UDP-glucose 4-epimerase GalE [Flavobacteriales bacterium]|nr:UDP-glucose 4-epimerase GalE [Flavobacteriales bacterium]
MNILITGGAGYIGSHTILEIFENTDWNVISVDNYSNSTPETYERIKAISGKMPEVLELDICEQDSLERVFEKYKIDGIIHFAALKSVPESVEKPLLYLKNNLLSLINLLNCTQSHGTTNFIFSSSCSVYGNTADLPVKETTKLERSESPYAYTKRAGEEIIGQFSNENKRVNFISLRYFNPVGAHKSGKIGELPIGIPNNLVPYITQTAAGIREQLTIFGDDYNTKDGTCVRDYVHVSDIANAHVLALRQLFETDHTKKHKAINLGTGNGISVLEAVKAFERINDLELNYKIGSRRAGDVAEVYADNTLAKKMLGWEPKRDLDEMMKSAWLWEQELSKIDVQ